MMTIIIETEQAHSPGTKRERRQEVKLKNYRYPDGKKEERFADGRDIYGLGMEPRKR